TYIALWQLNPPHGVVKADVEADVEAEVEAEVRRPDQKSRQKFANQIRSRGRSSPTRSEVEAEVPCVAKPPADWAGRRSGPCPPAHKIHRLPPPGIIASTPPA
ncbi:hypothetical protein THAOC_24752, partial [Thalassiosira oceanica]